MNTSNMSHHSQAGPRPGSSMATNNSHPSIRPFPSHPGGPPPPPPAPAAAPTLSTLPTTTAHLTAQAQSTLLFRQYLTDLSTSLFSFVLPLLPTTEELATKEEVRVLIERLIKTIEPSSRLLSFGSSCNSFGLRNSDMDLVCLIDNKEAALHASDLVAMIGDLLERETNFEVKPLPKARIPIIKLTLNPSPGLPFGIACDIGFENRLALENTRLLLTYATIDPARVRTLVLFLKVWSKRRKINSPYRGTLSSYGFTLMVLFFLVHVKNPPVLPNLQRIAPLRPMTKEEVTLEGRDVWFFDDTETLRKEWSSANFESIGELLIDFFRYYSHDFQYNNTVISIRAGHLTKESKGWMNDIDVGGLNENARDRNRLCIEDPFETPYNVARTVTKDGLYTIRGEFMRATRILTGRPERAVLALAELCVEREEELARAPRSASPAPKNVPAGRSAFGLGGGGGGGGPGGGWRNHMQANNMDRLSPTLNSLLGPSELDDFNRRPFPSHMAARRGRQSEPGYSRNFTSQELWLANQGLGLDFQLPPSAGGRHPGIGDNFRGRDTGPRQMDHAYGSGAGHHHHHHPPRRASSITENGGANGGMGFASGSASAPISPVKPAGQLHDQRNYGNSGTWSTGPSPRHAHAARMQGMMGGAGGGGAFAGPSYRRTSGDAPPASAGPAAGRGGAHVDRGAGGGGHFASQNRYPSSAYPSSMSANSRRAYSAGPSHHLGVPPNAQTDHSDVGGTAAGAGGAAMGSTSPLPAFQPFASSPPNGSTMLNGQSGGYASYISPSALLSPTPVVPPSLPMMNPFPAYHQSSTSPEHLGARGGPSGAIGSMPPQTTSSSRGSSRSNGAANGMMSQEDDALAGQLGRLGLDREGAGSAGSIGSQSTKQDAQIWPGALSNKPLVTASAPTSRKPSH